LRREPNGLYGAGGLDHDVERTARQSLRGGDRILVAHVHDPVRSHGSGELELLGPHAVGEEGSRRVQAGERDRERAERADADHADRLAGTRSAALEPTKHAGPGLHQHPCSERHAVRKAMHDVPGDGHVLAVAAAAREPDLVVVQTELRVAFLAAPAAVAGDHPLADHSIADLQVAHRLADLRDRAAPLVTRYERKAHPTRIGQPPVQHLQVGATHSGGVAPDEHFARAGSRRLELDVGDLVRPLDDDGLHCPTIAPPRSRSAG
jgi:hypothetical protein